MEQDGYSKRLKELRKEMGLTQTQLAKSLGATQRQISFWENGQIEPSIFWLIKIADFFDVTIDYLVGRN